MLLEVISSLPSARLIRAALPALAAALWCCAPAIGGVPGQPNIIVIVSDDAGYNEFGFANDLTGYPTTNAVTPNLDALAAQSVVMRQGYVTASICGASRTGLLLGQYQQRFGLDDNLNNDASNFNSAYGLPANQPTIANRLKSLGYTTGAIGKWHLGYADGVNRPQDKGFDEFYGFLGGERGYFPGIVNGVGSMHMRRGDAVLGENQLGGPGPTWATPLNGGYVTDAFGQEAVSFINTHAQDANPFFLYLAFTAPHSIFQGGPNGNGTLDIDYDDPQIATITNTSNRTTAALIKGMDRNVGTIMQALETQGIDDNTIVVFVNDNGGQPLNGVGNNQPFTLFKGFTYEGGIRVPFMIKAPQLTPGVYDRPVSTVDLMSTLIEAAGGDASQIATDGVDLMPYLEGQVGGDPHGYMFWRQRNLWVVRKGDWKYARPEWPPSTPWPYLWNLAATIEESGATNQASAQPQLVAELTRELTLWDATLAKPLFGSLGADDRNHFDHFVFRNDLAPVTTWSTAAAWRQFGTANNATLLIDDAYANAILEFTTRNDANYTASNDMGRMTGLTFMLNQIRLTGNFTGAAGRTATINSNAWNTTVNGFNAGTSTSNLLFVKSLTGQLPRLQLDATASGTPATFQFQVAHNLELLDDLEITGNGTQDFIFTGAIRDFYESRNVVKNGTSRVTLQGASTFHGSLTINAGEVRFSGPGASLNGPSGITIGSAGTLRLDQGAITVPTLNNAAGGQFEFNGGRLAVVNVLGNLTNSGGTFAPGASPAASSISGNFAQSAGKLEIELGGLTPGTQFDTLAVGGVATLGGTLEAKLTSGFVPALGQKFQFLSASHVQGGFSSYTLPVLGGGQFWSLQNTGQSVSLIVGIPGDYNGNNVVDAADYALWRNTKGSFVPIGSGADGNRDTQITEADYAVWKNNFGAFRIFTSGNGAAVPEPGAAILMLLSFALVATSRRRSRNRPRF